MIASALPNVEDPIPEMIGLGTVFAFAGAGGVLGTMLGSFNRLRTRKRDRDWWTSWGLAGGLLVGTIFYLLSLIAQVLS